MDTVIVARKDLEDLKTRLENLLTQTPQADSPKVEDPLPYSATPEHRLLAWRTSQERYILPNETRELRFRFSVRRPVEAVISAQPGLTLGQLKITRSDRGIVPVVYDGPVLPEGTILGTVYLATADNKIRTNNLVIRYGESRKPPMDPAEARKLLR